MKSFRFVPVHEKSGVVPPRFFAAEIEPESPKPMLTQMKEGTLLYAVVTRFLSGKGENPTGIRGRRASPLTVYYRIFSAGTQEKPRELRRFCTRNQ